jgi:hypothetical protein
VELARTGPSASDLAAAQKQLQTETRAAYASGRAWAGRLEGLDYRSLQRDPGLGADPRADLARAARDAGRSSRPELLDLLRRCVTDDARVQIQVSGTH